MDSRVAACANYVDLKSGERVCKQCDWYAEGVEWSSYSKGTQ